MMDMKKRGGWRPAVGILSVAGFAICLGIQGASAERAKPTRGERATKSSAQTSGVAGIRENSSATNLPIRGTATKGASVKAAMTPREIPRDGSARLGEPMWQPVGPEDLPGWPAVAKSRLRVESYTRLKRSFLICRVCLVSTFRPIVRQRSH